MKARTRAGFGLFVVGCALVALALAAFASPFASHAPDGLNRVAIDKGFAHTARGSAVETSPLAGYAVKGVENEKVSKGLSGVAGVAITFAVAGTAVRRACWVVARRRHSPAMTSP